MTRKEIEEKLLFNLNRLDKLFPPYIKDKILNNYDPNFILTISANNSEYTTLSPKELVISCSFAWGHSPEGSDFWIILFNNYRRNYHNYNIEKQHEQISERYKRERV